MRMPPAHTLNLIATTNAETAESDPAYKKIYRSTFGKCQGLWNKYGRSALAVKSVTDVYGLGLKRPYVIRWNSVLQRMVWLMKNQGDDEFRKLYSKLDGPKFSAPEKAFLEEYIGVMKPVAQALNILQSDVKTFMGHLLLMISILQEKLNTVSA